jgi:predicted RNA methylase
MKYSSVNSKNNNQCHKLELDQYYTSYEDMEYCVNKAWDVIKELGYDVSEFLEPSAGTGVFSNYLATSGLDVIAIDIDPKGDDIIKADFLTYELEYKKGRFVIGNPPYGARLSLAQKFYKRAIEIGDYIAFILPISQLNNSQFMYEFDLVHSEDLGKLLFSNKKKVHCCLNVYVRPKEGLNKKLPSKLNDITIIRQDRKDYNFIEYDIRMCYWGDGTAGKVLSEDEHYSGEYKIIIHNKELKKQIIDLFNTIDWKKELNSTAMRRIKQYHIIEVLKKYIPNIQ